MNIQEQMKRDLKMFMQMKADTEKTGIRMAMAAIKNKEIDLRHELSDEEIIAILKKQVKEHQESLSYLKDPVAQAGEIEKYNTYIEILKTYIPEDMSVEEATAIIKNILSENNIAEKKQMGNAMKVVMPVLKGKLDGKIIKEIVNSILK